MALRNRKPNTEPRPIIRKHKEPAESSLSGQQKVIAIFLAFVTCFGATWFINSWTVSRLYNPFPGPKVVELMHDDVEVAERMWGTYRSNLYFGMRTRTPESLLFGLAWFAQYPRDGQLHVRYDCNQGDGLGKYGWLEHDGRWFGSQEIVDDDFILTTNFVKAPGGKHGGDWTARVKGKVKSEKDKGRLHQVVSLMFIVSNEGSGKLTRVVKDGKMVEIQGYTPTLGSFVIKFHDPVGKVKVQTFMASHEQDIYDAKNIITNKLQYLKDRHHPRDNHPAIGLPGDVPDNDGHEPNFFVHQVSMTLPFFVDVTFESGSHEQATLLAGDNFVAKFRQRQQEFHDKFEETFGLKSKGFDEGQIAFAKAAFSNMIGGIGYFYGQSLVKSRDLKEPVPYWATALYTGVPSRSFFPRGFLWDEGFHQLMIQKWDPAITRDSLAHWLDLLNYRGWIPREQILGVEARRKVPDEFVVQNDGNANPPTFFLTIQGLMNGEKEKIGGLSKTMTSFLKHIFPRLQAWFEWYNTTQVGDSPGAYRWHGRDATTNRELNPKTLTSGLDDYPRASHPSNGERHVDMRCWIALAAGILGDIAEVIGENADKYRSTAEMLSDNNLLDEMHWSDRLKAYADYGNHTKFAHLEYRPINARNPNSPKAYLRVIRSSQGPTPKFVDAFGYISLFPFLLNILQPTSPKLDIILDDIRNPSKLWTEYGIRSMSATSPFYDKYNTEHDKPYWRGPIWLNINYLIVKALHHYASVEGPYSGKAKVIYDELRQHLISNMYKQYKKHGYIFEQYNDKNGAGQGCYPFTGWSGLITMIMAEL